MHMHMYKCTCICIINVCAHIASHTTCMRIMPALWYAHNQSCAYAISKYVHTYAHESVSRTSQPSARMCLSNARASKPATKKTYSGTRRIHTWKAVRVSLCSHPHIKAPCRPAVTYSEPPTLIGPTLPPLMDEQLPLLRIRCEGDAVAFNRSVLPVRPVLYGAGTRSNIC